MCNLERGYYHVPVTSSETDKSEIACSAHLLMINFCCGETHGTKKTSGTIYFSISKQFTLQMSCSNHDEVS